MTAYCVYYTTGLRYPTFSQNSTYRNASSRPIGRTLASVLEQRSAFSKLNGIDAPPIPSCLKNDRRLCAESCCEMPGDSLATAADFSSRVSHSAYGTTGNWSRSAIGRNTEFHGTGRGETRCSARSSVCIISCNALATTSTATQVRSCGCDDAMSDQHGAA